MKEYYDNDLEVMIEAIHKKKIIDPCLSRLKNVVKLVENSFTSS